MLDPIRPYDLKDNDDPKWPKSPTAIDDPTRAIPKTENAQPRRAKLRIDMELPKWTKSTTDRDEPNRPMPKIESAEPHRAKLRIDNVDPKCR
jgi:hypothetical protein